MRRDEKDESGGKVKWREESCVEQRVREKVFYYSATLAAR